MRYFVSLVLGLVTCFSVMGRVGDVIVTVQPVDAFTGVPLRKAYAQVIGSRGDTIADSRYRVADITIGYRTICLDLPDSTAIYKVRTFFEGYEPAEFELETRRKGKTIIEVPNNPMVKIKRQELKEVTVSASKVKMVMRGDTIVYNADAFQLANGSMLDALVSRLPGVTIEDGGNITVNGRKISELTINGEDFFQGNPRIALENLPAFTVKEIKVYEHGAVDSYITESDALEIDKPLRMDVNLKKEYVFGWMGNVEAGYGLHNRYLGKAFAFGFTNTFHFSAFANFNNIKDAQSSSGGRWTSGQQQNGEMDLQMGGADYMVKNKAGDAWTFRAQGNLIAQGNQSDLIGEQTQTLFYPSRDLFKHNVQQNNTESFNIKSNHNFEIRLPRVYANISPRIDFRRGNRRRSEEERSSYDLAVEEMIYTYQSFSRAKIEDLNLGLKASSTWSSKWRDDYANFNLNLGYHNNNENFFRNYALNYFDALTQNNRGDEHNLTRAKEYVASAGASYTFIPINTFTSDQTLLHIVPSLNYDFRQNKNDVTRSKHLEDAPIGTMASDQIKYVIDLNNSYYSNKYSHTVTPGVEVVFLRRWGFSHEWIVNFREKFTFDHIDYLKAAEETALSRQKALPEVSVLYRQHTRATWYIRWQYQQSAPNLSYLINTTDITDPLNRYIGNPNLRNSSEHSVNANIQISHYNIVIDVGWKKMDNYVAYTKFHNESTGVNTWQPKNVNGNWSLDGKVRFWRSFDKNNNWLLSSVTAVIYNHNVDLVTLSNEAQKSLVRNTCLTENINLTHNFGKSFAKLGCTFLWRHATSEREDFSLINAFDITPSFTLNLNLPYDFQIESDLKLYLRRGYSARELNTSDWGWNATLSKSIFKGNLKFCLTGVDILGQIKPIQTILNSQGRTEARYNTLPRYAILHVIYRLNIQPKKK